ncbi:MAG: hypothetical protein ACNA77_09625 [Opitutales bacterium]
MKEIVKKRLIQTVSNAIFLSALALVPTLAVYIDSIIFGHSIGELSVTEITQAVFLLITVAIFLQGAIRFPELRGGFVLIAGFFACALIREMDGFLDHIWHGFWLWPAITVAAGSVIYAFVCGRNVFATLVNFASTLEYYFMLFGMLTLFVFSRTFGSGSLLWKEVMGEGYTHGFKSALQEGLELYGYIFILYGAVRLWRKNFITHP